MMIAITQSRRAGPLNFGFRPMRSVSCVRGIILPIRDSLHHIQASRINFRINGDTASGAVWDGSVVQKASNDNARMM